MNLYLDKIASTDDGDGGSDDREHEGGALVSDTAHDATVAEEIVEQGPVADTSFFSLIHCQQVLMMMMIIDVRMLVQDNSYSDIWWPGVSGSYLNEKSRIESGQQWLVMAVGWSLVVITSTPLFNDGDIYIISVCKYLVKTTSLVT